MFGLNKKLRDASKKSKKENGNKKQVASTNANKTKSSITAIPDLICKSFVDGCLVLGCIHDIKNNELIVSLPGIGNFGYIKLNNISNIYSDLLKNIQLGASLSSHHKKNASNDNNVNTLLEMYNKGDLLRCKVLSYTDKKLLLTIEPNQVNASLSFKNLDEDMIISGAVKTKEDHGYTIDLGIEDLTGFYRTTENLSIGQCSLFKIVNKPSKRAINLKLCDSNDNTFYDLKTKYQFDSYLPGAKITNCTIEKVTKNGLQVNISNQLFAYVHTNHIPISKRGNLVGAEKLSKLLDDNKKSSKLPAYSHGDKLTGTIMFINPYSKVIYLSLLPHLNDSTKSAKISKLFFSGEESLKLGQIIEEAQVIMHTFKGIYVKFKGPNDKFITGFLPKRHLLEFESNDKEDQVENDEEDDEDGKKSNNSKRDAKNFTKEDIEKLFPLNSKIRARIYDFSLIEDIILLSCRPNVLNATFMNYDELSIGQIVKCTVKSINTKNGGVTVKLSEFVTGFIPKAHSGDVPLSENLLPRKLKPGTEIKCKIIQLNVEEKRCVLTAKNTLIKSKLPLIDSFSQLRLGMETYGVVISIQSYGLLLGFLNDLKGLLPRQEISSSVQKNDGQDLKNLYYVGQLIKCNVIDFDKEKQTIKLSLIRDSQMNNGKKAKNEEAIDFNKEKIEIDYEIGDLIEFATIVQVNEEKSYFKLKLPQGTKIGTIYKNHLSDLEFFNDFLFEYYKRTLKISNLMITQTSSQETFVDNKKSNKSHYLTAKASLIEFYSNHEIAKSFEELKPNSWHLGWIKKVLTNGLLVELPHSLNGFCPNQELKYLKELKSTNINGLGIGQSALVRINKLFGEKKRFTTNLRTRHDLIQKNSNDADFMTKIFKSFLTNGKVVFDYYSNTTIEKTTQVEKLISKVKIGSVVKVAIKSFNKASGRIECLFLDELESNNFNLPSSLIGYAYVDVSSSQENQINIKTFKVGAKFNAMVLAFDPLSRAYCLTLDKKKIKTYAKNFDTNFRSQLVCKVDQSIKAEVIYVSQWFCIVGLKAHALGRLAFMPLFRNDFTQLNTFKALNNESEGIETVNQAEAIDSKIKKEQVLSVSSASFELLLPNIINSEDDVNKISSNNKKKSKTNKDDKHFSYFNIGSTVKVILKSNDFDYAIVLHDLSSVKRNKKFLLRQLAILNENHIDSTSFPTLNGAIKRKLNEFEAPDETILIKKKVILNGDDNKLKKKRKLSENGEDLDIIEVVSDVKKSAIKKLKAELDTANKNENGHLNSISNNGIGSEFAWEVKDFDQFDQILNQNSLNVMVNGETSLQKKEPQIKKLKKTEKNMTIEEDLAIHQNEERLFDHNREPETTDDYERLIASRPNSSLWWIKYMVFNLQMAEIDKARNVAQQALKQILYKEDAERLNVWVALLNLENMYGTQATVDDIFNKACQNCDSFKIHCHMAEIYARSSKLQEAEGIFMKMTRKFSKSPDVWVKYGIFHYRNKNCELARKLLIKSFNSLDKRDHVEMVNKFAQLEFKYGDIERAKTMYDSLLFTYPNRTDIWSVYIDMLVKNNKFEDARHIFNRIIQLGLTAKRMKFIFKKYIDFEKMHGTEDSIEKAKELAIEYVEKNSLKSEKKESDMLVNSSIEENLKKSLKI